MDGVSHFLEVKLIRYLSGNLMNSHMQDHQNSSAAVLGMRLKNIKHISRKVENHFEIGGGGVSMLIGPASLTIPSSPTESWLCV